MRLARTRKVLKALLLLGIGSIALLAVATYATGCGTASVLVLNRSGQRTLDVQLTNTPSRNVYDEPSRTVWQGTVRSGATWIHLRNLLEGKLKIEVAFDDGTRALDNSEYVKDLPRNYVLYEITKEQITAIGWYAPFLWESDGDILVVAMAWTFWHIPELLACSVVREITGPSRKPS